MSDQNFEGYLWLVASILMITGASVLWGLGGGLLTAGASLYATFVLDAIDQDDSQEPKP